MWKQPLAGGQAPDYGPSRAPTEVHRWCACGVRVWCVWRGVWRSLALRGVCGLCPYVCGGQSVVYQVVCSDFCVSLYSYLLLYLRLGGGTAPSSPPQTLCVLKGARTRDRRCCVVGTGMSDDG